MLEEKRKNIFNLMKELQDKQHKELHEVIPKIDDGVNLDDFSKNHSNRDLKDVYIFKDDINKGNISFGLYLINYEHTDLIALDKDYQPLPLNKRLLFEYGAVVSFPVGNYDLDISGVFGGIEEDKETAINKYNQLRQYINMMSEEKLLDAIEKNILKELNS